MPSILMKADCDRTPMQQRDAVDLPAPGRTDQKRWSGRAAREGEVFDRRPLASYENETSLNSTRPESRRIDRVGPVADAARHPAR